MSEKDFDSGSDGDDSDSDVSDWESLEQVMESVYPEYWYEELEVTTNDGFILTMHHIWNEESRDSSKGPVMAMHGSMMDSLSFLGEDDSFVI